MKRLGIKYQVLLITLIPVFLIDSFFTFRHVRDGIAQQHQLLHDKAQISARRIVEAIELNRMTGKDAEAERLLREAVTAADIVLASIYNSRGELVATAAASDYERADSADYYYLRQPLRLANPGPAAPLAHASAETAAAGSVNLYLSRSSLNQKIMQIVAEAGLLFMLVLALAVTLTSLISRRITRPLFRLIEHLRRIETGELGMTIETTESNEIGALQKGFNRMSQALLANRRHLNQRIQQATQQLNATIADLESSNRELGFARDLAQDADRAKSEFLANMSHEIRTPINSIKGFIGLLGQSSLEPSQRRYVDIILKSTNDLTGIVNEILDFSKMESGKLQIVDEEFDLYEVIEQTRDILFINVLSRGIDLNLVIFSDTPRWVIGDKLRLKQILLNLVGNAIKFTDFGRVVIQVTLQDLDDDQVAIRISVKDSGIGISAKDQQSLFQAFSQVESSNTQRFTGTGLGLVISKNLAQLMGGNISMQSVAGEGSEFSLDLPFKLGARHEDDSAADFDALRSLIFAVEPTNLMEIRTLYDRAGAITEAELIDCPMGMDAILRQVQRNLACFDLLVFDLRGLDLDLEQLLKHVAGGPARIIVMHYDPGYELPLAVEAVEYVSIISTCARIRQLLLKDTAIAAEPRPTPATSTGAGKQVLLVDDNQLNLKLAGELIRLWGHQVQEAMHATEAFDIYRRNRFDLIILDIQMPDIDGISLLQMMRNLKPEDNTPIVALTANVLNREAERLLDLGFDYFLGKPIDEASFRSLLDGEPRRRDLFDTDDLFAGEAGHAVSTLDFARSLQLAAGNESLLRQILEILQRDIPQQRHHLQDAYQDFDIDRLGALAHKLHGVTCYASLPRLRRIVRAFEVELTAATAESLQTAVAELDRELAAVAEAVDLYLQQFPQTA